MNSPPKITQNLGGEKIDPQHHNAAKTNETQSDSLKESEAEFFQHLNLSKCDALHKSTSEQTARPIKQPVTRHLRSSLSVKKQSVSDKEHVWREDAESNPSSDVPVDLEPESKEADISKNKEPDTDDPESEEDAGGGSGDYGCTEEQDDARRTTSKEQDDEMEQQKKVLLKLDMDAGTDFDLLKKEEKLKKEYPCPPYRCSMHTCTSEFTRWEKFMRHLRKHTGQLPYTCVRCNLKFKHRSDLMSHLKRHIGIKTLKCAECGETFEKSRSLTSHMIARHGANDSRPRKFKCTECGDAFLSKMAVDRHIRCWHTGYRPKSCHICGASFHTDYDLKTHITIHSGEKPYKCEECDYHARTVQLLKRHKKSHTKKKPYMCKECDFTCSHSGSLKRHALTHLDTKPYKCPYCSHRCSDLNNLKKHIRKVKKHKGLKVYPCSHCTFFSTDDGSDYLRHMKQYHFPYLDMRTATAAKVSGILTEDVDKSAPDELVNNNLFNDENDTVHDQISLSDISRNTTAILPELSIKANVDDFPGARGDIFLSSVASEDNNVTQEATFISDGASFGEDPCLAQSLSSNDTESGPSNLPPQPCERQNEATVNMDDQSSSSQHGIGLGQQYVAVLVNWPSDQKLQESSSGSEGPLTLVINSNPVLLGNPKQEDTANISPKSYFTGDWTCFGTASEGTTQKSEHDVETDTNPS